MALNTISRGALSAYTKAVRLPFDAALPLVGRDPDSGLRAAAGLALDQVQATVLGVAGRVFGDQELQDDAAGRFRAADARREALRLRTRAEEVSEDAEERVAKREAEAENERQARKARAARTEQSRHRANARATAARKEAVQERGKVDRLEAVEEKAEALELKSEALTAKNEAQRLGKAAAAVKTERKRQASKRR